jgi:type II restriction/modification system DNA methylase subunit YeeA
MPIKTNLTYNQIGKNLEAFKEPIDINDIPYILLSCFGTSDTVIARYKKGLGIIVKYDGLLIKKTFAYRTANIDSMYEVLDQMKQDEMIRKNGAPILAVSDGISILAYDPAMDETYENKLNLLYTDYSFFSPIWGIRKYRAFEENDADVKAAYKMAKLHDEIRRENEFSNEDDLHDLNLFMSRLLFCFFAEDTGIFEDNLFTHSIEKYTKSDGSDLSEYLGIVFNLMESPRRAQDLNKAYSSFPYVNGGLFAKKIQIPRLGLKVRNLILDCGHLNWKSINPDIFGSMIQAVVTPELRSGLGLHYTSVPNIMKLIGPLFLDELESAFDKQETIYKEKKRNLDIGGCTLQEFRHQCKSIVTACEKLLKRIFKMKFFDPACGSGNFLVITYKRLRMLENQILQLIVSATGESSLKNLFSVINISQFYGVELDDFACETAILSLWLAEHQMNCVFTEQFGVQINALPLKANTNIQKGNACRLNWEEVCPHTPEEEVFIMGNPPYLGSKLQSKVQKDDIEFVFSELRNSKILDYISIWFYLGALYSQNSKTRYAFVSTNSICQGEQVSILWPLILSRGLAIFFAHQSFKWNNNAKYNAGVTCVIVGVCVSNNSKKNLYTGDVKIETSNINPYLSVGNNAIVHKNNKTPKGLPKVCFGYMPYDNGNLLMDLAEKTRFIEQYPQYEYLLKPIYGSYEFINGVLRYCFWISDTQLREAENNPEVKERIEKTKTFRLYSPDASGRDLASRSHQFREYRELNSPKIIIPAVSSERREYIPIGYLDEETVVSNSAFAIFDAPEWLFGILTSNMHMLWVKTVGGRLKTDYRYSATLCYNTFPFPSISDTKKSEIEEAANKVLDARDWHIGKTLAELYDPDKMPEDLRQAHHELDLLVESCYQDKTFKSDEERLECLFKLYEEMTKKL